MPYSTQPDGKIPEFDWLAQKIAGWDLPHQKNTSYMGTIAEQDGNNSYPVLINKSTGGSFSPTSPGMKPLIILPVDLRKENQNEEIIAKIGKIKGQYSDVSVVIVGTHANEIEDASTARPPIFVDQEQIPIPYLEVGSDKSVAFLRQQLANYANDQPIETNVLDSTNIDTLVESLSNYDETIQQALQSVLERMDPNGNKATLIHKAIEKLERDSQGNKETFVQNFKRDVFDPNSKLYEALNHHRYGPVSLGGEQNTFSTKAKSLQIMQRACNNPGQFKTLLELKEHFSGDGSAAVIAEAIGKIASRLGAHGTKEQLILAAANKLFEAQTETSTFVEEFKNAVRDTSSDLYKALNHHRYDSSFFTENKEKTQSLKLLEEAIPKQDSRSCSTGGTSADL